MEILVHYEFGDAVDFDFAFVDAHCLLRIRNDVEFASLNILLQQGPLSHNDLKFGGVEQGQTLLLTLEATALAKEQLELEILAIL